MAPGKKQKVLVEWSCSDCTKGATFPKKGPNAHKSGHCNYKGDTHCRKCKASKGECHLCAYSDLGQKLKDGLRASGNDTAANNSKSGGGGGARTKREKMLEKEGQDLKKLLGQSKPDADGGADVDATVGDVDVKELRASLACTKKFFDDYRAMYMEDVPPEALAANTDEFENCRTWRN